MLAFHNDQHIKDFYVARVLAHQQADEIVQGQYWHHGKGCAVGCTLHATGGDHARYETELGIPRQIAHFQDRLFEALPNGEAKTFPLAFLTAIPVGAELSLVMPRLMVWLLADAEAGVLRFVKSEQSKAANAAVVKLYTRLIAGESVETEDWQAARVGAYAAYSAYAGGAAYAAYAAAAVYAAYAAAAYAADAAAAAYDAAAYAAYAAAAYAAYAAAAAYDAAAYAADAAAAYAADAAYAYAADAAAREAHFLEIRDKLLDLLASAPVPVNQEAS